MKAGIRGKLFLVSVGLIATSAIAADAYLAPALDDDLTSRIRADLLVRARLVEREASLAPGALDDVPAWDALADELGRRAGARVTLIRADGVVLGDSEVPTAGIRDMENHRARPEVVEALAGSLGGSTRLSATLGERMMYVAVPFARQGRTAGVARVAMPLVEVDRALARLRRVLVAGLVLGLGIAVLMSSGAAHLTSRSVRHLTDAARRMAQGDLETRARVGGRDELGELGRALDQLAGNLSRTLAELRGERDLLGRILEGMHEGVLVLDAAGRLALVNPALREMLLLPVDAIGKSPIEVVRNAELQEILERSRRAGEPAAGEIDIGGLKPRRLLVRASTLSGEPADLLAVFVDVTETRRLEAMRKDFVANASHELRTPITSVRSAAETLQAGAVSDPAAAKRFVEMIDRNAERLQRLVEDLLDLSHIESKEYRPSLETIELEGVVERVLLLFRERAERKHVRLAASLPPALPGVRADRRALEQVLTNLVDNAVKYGPEGSSITVRADAHDGRVRVLVGDTGPGIEAQHLPRLFERFYRVDPGRSRDMGGTGLGLSIVKHLVETMGGHVTVESAPGRGSTFAFTLPPAP